MADAVPFRHPGAPDLLSEDGRFGRIRAACALAGVPSIALYLFERGGTPEEVVVAIAEALGFRQRPTSAPFPDLIADPFPQDDD